MHGPLPFDRTWWICEGKLLGGKYPGTPSNDQQEQMLASLIDCGVRVCVNLQEPQERGAGGKPFPDYAPMLSKLAAARGVTLEMKRFPVPDQDVPDPSLMQQILDFIDSAIEAGKPVYLHCWGGNGRTGTVAGCWLVRHGRSAQQAFSEMAAGRVGRGFRNPAPENDHQRQFVCSWKGHTPKPVETAPATDTSDRSIACLLGLAIGDAVGTAVEFEHPGTFKPLTDMVGGGKFHLQPGQWTDDTSMALCLAESLVECRGFDPRDQMERYRKWRDTGHWSPTGTCFDIGGTVNVAIDRFTSTGLAYAGSTDCQSAGNGCIMRLAPIPIAYAARPSLAIALAGESSRTTHGTAECIDACRYFAGLLVGLISGAPKNTVLSAGYTPVSGLWQIEPLAPKVAAIAAGSFKQKSPPAIRGTGYVIDCLEAALWAFYRTDNFRDAILAAANLGYDADTTAAVTGQLAGACYGTTDLPAPWLTKLALRKEIATLAKDLVALHP